ncbi:ABC transporter permease subunit [Agrobacterium rhizogenes]|uniref:ABC transporter permease subunit n=1 Tax=Rhizobium rhizogenes TaxID=359 RepID=UPI001574B602|nr:ABC transporter permease subunit [Rhizobium rhizogenes]NTF91669.1 ABC transporter permease subunit [Rhizobium rhizogenes]
MFSLLRNQKVLNTAVQVAFAAGLLLLISLFVVEVRHNLEKQGIRLDPGFLERSTGWDINFALIEYTPGSAYWVAILAGIINTLFAGVISLVLASCIGLLIGVMRVSKRRISRSIATIYVETFRNVPLLLQLFLWYALLRSMPAPRNSTLELGAIAFTGRGVFLPSLNVNGRYLLLALGALILGLCVSLWPKSEHTSIALGSRRTGLIPYVVWTIVAGVVMASVIWGRIPGTDLLDIPRLNGLNYQGGMRLPPEFLAIIIGISVYGGAYIAEIFRAGFQAVPTGVIEAGMASGLSGWQIFSRLHFPLAVRIVIPSLTNQYIWLIKATTLGIAIGFYDFFMSISVAIVNTGQTIVLIGLLMAGFLALNFTLAQLMNFVNRKVSLKGHG